MIYGEFTCDLCKKTFPKSRSDKEAREEQNLLFPGQKDEDMVMNCEDCFIKVMEFNEPGQKRYLPFKDTG